MNAFVRASVQDTMISLFNAAVKPINAVSVPPTVISTLSSNVYMFMSDASASFNGTSGTTTLSLEDCMTPTNHGSKSSVFISIVSYLPPEVSVV